MFLIIYRIDIHEYFELLDLLRKIFGIIKDISFVLAKPAKQKAFKVLVGNILIYLI